VFINLAEDGRREKMEIGEEHRGDITIVEIKGRIDTNTASSLGERLTALTDLLLPRRSVREAVVAA
jgi:hypothetical protein